MIDFIAEVVFYALWCWGAYALHMGAFMATARELKSSITHLHIIVCVLFSMFGVYSFIFAFVRTVLIHGLTFPISWNMNTGTVPTQQD